MDLQWYYVHNGQQEGPIPAPELLRLLQTGVLAEDTAVWADGLTDWVALGSTDLVDGGAAAAAGGAALDAPPSKRRRVELRALPQGFAAWLPGLDAPSKMRLFGDAIVFYRPQIIAGLPEARDALLAAYVQRHPDVEDADRDPETYDFTDAFFVDVVEELSNPEEAWELLGEGNEEAVAAMIGRAAQMDEKYLGQVYALHMLCRAQAAIDAGDAGALLALQAEDPGVAGARDLAGRSVWHRLAAGPSKSAELMRALLAAVDDERKQKAYLNLPDSVGNRALHLAAEAGNLETARLLLEVGASPSPQNKDSSQYASSGSWQARVKGLDYALPIPEMDQTPLHLAIEAGHHDVVALLLEHGAAVDVRDASGAMPLHLALEEQDEEAAEMLLNAGAQPAAPMGDGETTPLHHCASRGQAALLRLLLATGKVDVNQPGPQGWRPLALAARRGSAACVRQLLATGAEVAARSQGKTALEIARINKRAECVEVLEAAEAAAGGAAADSSGGGGNGGANR